MIRAFVALPIPEHARALLRAAQTLLPLPRPVDPAQFHVTLAFLGEITEPDARELHGELSRISAARFRLQMDGVGVFGGDKPRNVHALVSPEPALDQLARKVARAARQAGLKPEARRFVPHVTLGRFRPGQIDMSRLESALADCAGLSGSPFEVDHFTLMESVLRPKGPIHTELARYELVA